MDFFKINNYMVKFFMGFLVNTVEISIKFST